MSGTNFEISTGTPLPSPPAAGDLVGVSRFVGGVATPYSYDISKFQLAPSSAPTAAGQALTWNGAAFAWVAPSGGGGGNVTGPGTSTVGHVALFAGTNGQTLEDGGALAPSATTDTTNASNISSGVLSLALLAQGGAGSGQVLEWNGTAWAPASIGTGSGTVGAGTTGQIPQYAANGNTVGGVTISGDVTIAAGGAATVGKIGGHAVALGAALTFSGAYSTTITLIGPTTVTLPTSGTLLAANGSGAALTGITAGQISGLAPSATTDTTNGSNISSGTVAAARLPALSALSGSLSLGQIAQGGAASGQVMEWNGTAWAAASIGTGSGTVGAGTTGQIAQYSANGTTVGGVSISGDVTIAAGGAATIGAIGGHAVSLVGALTFSGAYSATITLTGPTTVTLPTSGTLLAANGSGAALTGITAGQISGLAPSATTDTTNGSNISSGTVAAARLPALSALSGLLSLAQIAQGGATSGQALEWNGTAWAPATISGGGSNLNPVSNIVTSGTTINPADTRTRITGGGPAFTLAAASDTHLHIIQNLMSVAITVTSTFWLAGGAAASQSISVAPGGVLDVIYDADISAFTLAN